MTQNAIQNQILANAIGLVAFDGFNASTLARAAAEAGFDRDDVAMAFPRGVIDLAVCYAAQVDQRLLDRLEEMDLPSMKIRTRIATALKTRIALLASERETYRRLIQFFAQPGHVIEASKSLYRSVDAIWLAAGDTATDYNFYSKRLILAGVISSATLFWLQDDSEAFAQTDAFIDRRIDDVMQFEKAKAKLTEKLHQLPDIAGFLGRLRYGGLR